MYIFHDHFLSQSTAEWQGCRRIGGRNEAVQSEISKTEPSTFEAAPPSSSRETGEPRTDANGMGDTCPFVLTACTVLCPFVRLLFFICFLSVSFLFLFCFFLSRCRFSTPTPRQPLVELFVLTCPPASRCGNHKKNSLLLSLELTNSDFLVGVRCTH